MTISTRATYKDRLFNFIFGKEERKAYTLDLYNALNNSNYKDPEKLELTTIEDVIYLSMKDDLSFIIDRRMNLYEQQSTFNPNMPVRGLIYFGKLYDKYLAVNNLNVYGHKRLILPVPKFVVFYNGAENQPIRTTMRLSDSFLNPAESDVEVVAKMININADSGDEILVKCDKLREYAIFVEKVRNNLQNGMDRDGAVTAAINDCINEEILGDLLIAHKSEVVDMILTEYDEEKTMNMFFQEGANEREEQLRQLYRVMKREGRLEEYDEAMESENGDRIAALLKDYQEVISTEVNNMQK